MAGKFRKSSNHETTKPTETELSNNYIEFYNKKIEELEKEYTELIQQPYQAGRLSEIVSELGRMWNEKLRYEDIESTTNGNGAKNMKQVQDEVSSIVQEVKQQIAISKESDEKLTFFMDGLLKLRHVLDEWESGL